MRIAIITRLGDFEEPPFNVRYYLYDCFRRMFDELDVLLIPIVSEKHLDDVSDLCDALVITGSPNDVHPKYFGEEVIPEKTAAPFDEYNMVKTSVEMFMERGKPILGICAGIQELNVIFGGTLHQRIQGHALKEHDRHVVHFEPDSFLSKAFGSDKAEVNSFHSQCLKDVAPGFRVTAHAEDGTIEGMEKDNIVAVQWHPEGMYDVEFIRNFIETYVK